MLSHYDGFSKSPSQTQKTFDRLLKCGRLKRPANRSSACRQSLAALSHQLGRGGFDVGLQSFLEGLAGKARRDQRQEFQDDGAGEAQEFPAGPEQAGIHGKGQAGAAQGAVEGRGPGLVGGGRIGGLPRAFRHDDDLPACGEFLNAPCQKLAQGGGASAPFQPDHAEFENEPAKKRNP